MRIYHSLLNATKFRRVFDFGEREVAHWFPGHMAKGACHILAITKSALSNLLLHRSLRHGPKVNIQNRDISIIQHTLVTDLIYGEQIKTRCLKVSKLSCRSFRIMLNVVTFSF